MQGDSPMVQYYGNDRARAIGINSQFHLECNTCPLMLSTKVSSYIDWIRDNLIECTFINIILYLKYNLMHKYSISYLFEF